MLDYARNEIFGLDRSASRRSRPSAGFLGANAGAAISTRHRTSPLSRISQYLYRRDDGPSA